MMNRIAIARRDVGLTPQELADKLGVNVTTVLNWESGRRQFTLERLAHLASALGISATYLLGIDERVDYAHELSKSVLPILHRTPVWTASHGWALVNTAAMTLVFTDKSEISFDEVQESLYAIPPIFALGLRGTSEPLGVEDVLSRDRVWVEPVSLDAELAAEFRGWYRPHKQCLVENELGHRFYLDTYGAKWLAFASCFTESEDE